MNNGISLRSDGRDYEIPLLEFVAGWAAVCNDSICEDIEDSVHAAWRKQALPLAAWPAGDNGPVMLESVEALCRILCNKMDWRLRGDPRFCERNASILVVSNSCLARLHESGIRRWDATDLNDRNGLLGKIDGRIFAVLVTSGNSLD